MSFVAMSILLNMKTNTNNDIWIFTLFPDYFKQWLETGVMQRAKSSFNFHLINIRDYSDNKYRSVDDAPYGGGHGMVLRADILALALQATVFDSLQINASQWHKDDERGPWIIFPSARGKIWHASKAKSMGTRGLVGQRPLVFICGRYEGVDERFIDQFVHEEISIGDFVLAGGEIAVSCILESALRFYPGILGNPQSVQEDSFEDGLLDCAYYTRPAVFRGQTVPEVLLNGNHAEICKYKVEQKKILTKKWRPDLWERYETKT